MKNIFLLFGKFFKIGLFTFGGGYAMISLIQNEVVENMKWLDDKEMTNMIVIAESTPGVLAVNTATFTGYKIAGIAGAAAATLGVALPSLIIIGIISLFFDDFKNLKYIAYAFNGIKAGVVLLIINAVIKLDKKNKKDIFYYVIVFLAAAASVFFKVNAVYILLVSAVLGIIYSLIFVKIPKSSNSKGDK
jgi:chromate transporter